MAIYSLRTLSRLPGIRSIILVVSPDLTAQATEVVRQYAPWPLPVLLTAGGAERQDSVAGGLAMLDAETEWVIVHDAARPFVSLACVSACIDAAQTTGAAIVALPARDTIKQVESGGIVRTIDRQTIWLAQTPQVFRTSLLRRGYELARGMVGPATDDAALVERAGATVRVVVGEETNRKITTPDDLRWAEWYLTTQRA